MGSYSVVFDRRALRDLERLPPSVRRRFSAVFEELSQDPFERRPLCDIRRLHGQEDLFAVRVGAYRGVYTVAGREVRFGRFRHRSVAYR